MNEVQAQDTGTLTRGLHVLRCFGSGTSDLGNRELSELTGYPKSTVSRLTSALTELGYLQRVTHGRRFALGPAAVRTSYPILARLAFRRLTLPYLDLLAAWTRGDAVIAVQDCGQMVVIESASHGSGIGHWSWSESSNDFAHGSAGRCWLINASDAERQTLVRRVSQGAPLEMERLRTACDAGRQQIAEQGFVRSENEMRSGAIQLSTALHRRAGDELLILAVDIEPIPPHAELVERCAGVLLMETSRQLALTLARELLPSGKFEAHARSP